MTNSGDAPAVKKVDFLTRLRLDALGKHVKQGSKTLEIGAFVRPTLNKPEYDAHFVDFYSTEELKKQCIANGGDADAVVDVDFVVKDDVYHNVVEGKFDVIVANHVFEHVRNPIKWLIDVGSMLNEDGVLFLSVPDKRFSFDKFRDDTSISHILSDYLDPSDQRDIEHCIDTEIFYDRTNVRRENSLDISLSFDRIKWSITKYHPGIHCHVFDGRTFLNKILKPLVYMKVIPFLVEEYIPETPAGEFYIVLRKGAPETDLTKEAFFIPAAIR